MDVGNDRLLDSYGLGRIVFSIQDCVDLGVIRVNLVDIIVGVSAIALVIFTVAYNFKKKAEKGTGCAYCDGCAIRKDSYKICGRKQ